MGRIAEIGKEIRDLKGLHCELSGGDLTGLSAQLYVLERERELIAGEKR